MRQLRIVTNDMQADLVCFSVLPILQYPHILNSVRPVGKKEQITLFFFHPGILSGREKLRKEIQIRYIVHSSFPFIHQEQITESGSIEVIIRHLFWQMNCL